LKENEPKRTFAETSFPYGAEKLRFSAPGIHSKAQGSYGLTHAFLVNSCKRILKHAQNPFKLTLNLKHPPPCKR